jgi:hypothetical protein
MRDRCFGHRGDLSKPFSTGAVLDRGKAKSTSREGTTPQRRPIGGDVDFERPGTDGGLEVQVRETPADVSGAFAELDAALRSGGASSLFARLEALLMERRQYRQLFEALLLRHRYELGLPLEGTESIRDLPADVQELVEQRYVEVCRTVGGAFLRDGDIRSAWPYFQAIDEPGPVAMAIEAWSPKRDSRSRCSSEAGSSSEAGTQEALSPDDPGHFTEGVDVTDAMVDIAFYQGAHPVRGYELILSEYGTCRAVTIFEHQFPHSKAIRASCARLLVRHLSRDLLAGLRADLERRGVAVPQDASVRSLIETHPELFAEQYGYHVDLSHLQAAVRAAAGLEANEDLLLGIDLCEYGRRLSRDFQSAQDRAPFDDFYNDYRILLRAFVGEGVDGAVRYFRAKADRAGPDESGHHFSGEVLVHLLDRVGRRAEAVTAYRAYLGAASQRTTLVPSFLELCARAKDFAPALALATEKDDLLGYASALVRNSTLSAPSSTTSAS